MKKEQFNKLDIDNQIEYFNNKLYQGESLTSICKSIGIGRSTISDRFKKYNYKYNKSSNQYELLENNINNTDVITTNNGSYTTVEKIENANNDNVLDIVNLDNEDIKNNLLSLASEYEILQKIIDDYRRNSSVIKKQIVIDIPDADSKITTLRINKTVLDMFNEFAEDNKQYKKVDLLSQALLDFLNAYR